MSNSYIEVTAKCAENEKIEVVVTKDGNLPHVTVIYDNETVAFEISEGKTLHINGRAVQSSPHPIGDR